MQSRLANLNRCNVLLSYRGILHRGTRGNASGVPRVVIAAAEPHSLNLNKAVDKAHEAKSLQEIISLPPSALQGLPERIDDQLATLRINSIKDLGMFKFYKAAVAISVLAATEVKNTPLSLPSFNAKCCKFSMILT